VSFQPGFEFGTRKAAAASLQMVAHFLSAIILEFAVYPCEQVAQDDLTIEEGFVTPSSIACGLACHSKRGLRHSRDSRGFLQDGPSPRKS